VAWVWRWRDDGSGAKVRGEGGGAVQGGGLNRPGETRLACGPAGKRRGTEVGVAPDSGSDAARGGG
jgi:hypothetical protein